MSTHGLETRFTPSSRVPVPGAEAKRGGRMRAWLEASRAPGPGREARGGRRGAPAAQRGLDGEPSLNDNI